MERDSVSLEELLQDYEQELENTRSHASDRNKEVTEETDTEAEFEAKLKTCEVEKRKLQDRLHNLREKIGRDLVQLMEMNDNKEDKMKLKETEEEENKFYFLIIGKMEEEQKTLADIVSDYEANIDKLQTEDGKLDEVSKLETKINELETESKEHQKKLQILTEKLGDKLASDILNMKNEKAFKSSDESQRNIVTKMAKDDMTLAEVLLDYEEELDKCHKELEGKSKLFIVSSCQNETENLKYFNADCHESLNKVEEKIGKGLCETLLRNNTDEEEPNATVHLTLQAVEIMNEENKPLSMVITEYEAQLRKLKSENECLKKLVESDEEMKSVSEIVLEFENKLTETKEKQKMSELKFEDLRKKIGCNLADEIQDTDEQQRSSVSLRAIDLMTREEIPLSGVIKKYEIDLQTLQAENEDLKTLKSRNEEQENMADKTATLERPMTENECRYGDEFEKCGEELSKIKKELNNLKEKIGQDLITEMEKLDTGKNKTFCLRAVEYMAQEEKPLSEVIKVYENKLDKLEKYDDRTTNPKQEQHVRISDEADEEKTIEKQKENETTEELGQYEGEHRQQLNASEESIDQEKENLNKLIDRLGEDLAQRIIALEENKRSSGPFKALDLMNEENKTLSDIIDEYEDEIVTLRRENKIMQRFTSGKDDGETIGDIVTEYENELSTIERKNKYLQANYDQLIEKVGRTLATALTETVDHGHQDCTLDALRIMQMNNKSLLEVVKQYEDELEERKRVTEEENDGSECFRDKKQLETMSKDNAELDKELNQLKQTVGQVLVKGLINPEEKQLELRALEVLRKKEQTIVEVLKDYEEDHDRLERENKMLKKLSTKKSLGESSLSDMDSEDKNKDKQFSNRENELEEELNSLRENIGVDFVKEITKLDAEKKDYPIKALFLMVNEKKQLSQILIEYEAKLEKLQREHDSSRRFGADDDKNVVRQDIVSEYEEKLTQARNKLEKSENDLKLLSERIGDELMKEIEKPGILNETDRHIKASEIMLTQDKSLSDVIKDYEHKIETFENEISLMRDFTNIQRENASDEEISKQEEQLAKFTRDSKEFEKDFNKLKEKVGTDLADALISPETDHTGSTAQFRVLHVMRENNTPLCEVFQTYEDHLEKVQRELDALKHFISEDSKENSSVLDIISGYETTITDLKEENIKLNKTIKTGEKNNITSTEDARSSERDIKCVVDEANQTRNEDKSLHEMQDRVQEGILPADVQEVNKIDLQQQTEGWDNNNNLTDKGGRGTKTHTMIRDEENLQNLKESRDDLQHKLTVLERRMGKNLGSAIIDMETGKQEQLETTTLDMKPFAIRILDKMAAESKTLTEVIEEQESELTRLSTKNQILQNMTDKDENNMSVLEAMSNYEGEIKSEKEKNRDLEHKLDVLYTKLGSKLSEDLLQLGEEGEKSPPTEYGTSAAKRIAEEKKPLAEILKEYEDDIRKLNIANNKVSDYEEKLKKKEEEKEVVKKELDDLSLKVGKELCQELTDKSKGDQGRSRLIVLQLMDQKGIPLAKVIEDYEDNIHKLDTKLEKLGEWVGHDLKEKILEFDKSQAKNVEYRFPQELTMIMYREDKTLADVVAGYEAELMQLRRENNNSKANERDIEFLTDKLGHDLASEIMRSQQEISKDHGNTNLKLKALDKMGKEKQTIAEILESYEDEIEKVKEEKSQLKLLTDDLNILTTKAGKNLTNDLLKLGTGSDLGDTPCVNALLTLQKKGNTLEEIIQEYENKIQKLEGDDDHMHEHDGEHKNDNTTKDFKTRINELEIALEKEKTDKETLQKDVQDLLQDIIGLKMKQANVAADHEDDEHSLKDKLKEEYELQQQNKLLQDELQQEKQTSKALGESKVELSNELENTIAENLRIVEAKDKIIKENENKFSKQEHDISLLRTKNDSLESDVKNLNKQLKENIDKLNEIEKVKFMREKDRELQTTSEMENLKREKEKTERSLEEQKDANQELKKNVDELQEEVNKLNELYAQTGSEIVNEKELADKNNLYEKQKNESLKNQLDENEEILAETIKRYQDQVSDLEQQKEKLENQLNQEIEILAHKLELERTTAERQKKDFDEALNREREHVKQGIELELSREKERLKNEFDYSLGEHKVSEEKLRKTIDESEDSHKEEKKEMTIVFLEEKNRLQDVFNGKLNAKDEEYRRTLEQIKHDMESNFAREKHELVEAFEKEKEDIQSSAREKIVEEVSAKKSEIEADFQAMLSHLAKEHEHDIEAVEKDLKVSAEKFKEEKQNIVSKMQDEKEELIIAYEKEKKLLESTIQNLLKEIVKLKHQRKELRHIHRKEKAEIEEICEQEKVEMKINFDRCKTDLVEKLQEDFSQSISNEISKREALIENLRYELNVVETRNKNLELQLTKADNEREPQKEVASLEVAQKNNNRGLRERIEQEYEKKLEKEKHKFEETMQGLRREVNTLQEKRKLIQDRVYNQDHGNNEQKVIEKSIANYKKEILTKLEEEMLQKVTREKRPLEESIAELQRENEELKQHKWELKSQFRRERLDMEEEFEKEKENIESRFVREKEDLKSKYESRVQKEQMKRAMVEKVHRATSPADSLDSSRSDEATRALQWEKIDLQDDNEHLKGEIKRLTMKLESLETNFQDVMANEKAKVQRMKQIQEKIPKRVTFSDEVNDPRETYLSPSTSNNDQKLLQAVKEKDARIRQLQDAKRLYENIFGELCEEAGLFELDQDIFS